MKIARNRRGTLLVVTLWTVVILGMLALAIGRQMALELRMQRFGMHRQRAQALARGGVALAMERLTRDAEDADEAYDWLGDDWAAALSVALPEGRVEITVADEERKLNLNQIVDPAVLERVVVLVGGTDQAELAADAVDPDTDPRPGGAESLDSPPYLAKSAPLTSLLELRSIPGLRPETLAALENETSVSLAAESRVNLNTASAEVLSAMGLASLAEVIVAFREQGHYFTSIDPELLTESPAVPAPFDPIESDFANVRASLGVESQTFRVVSTGVVGTPEVRARVEAIVRRSGCGEGRGEPCVIGWLEP